MTEVYTPAQVVERYLSHGQLGEVKDPERWLRRRLADGRIPGKWLSRRRGLVVMTDKHIDQWLNGDEQPATPTESTETTAITAGVTTRAARRLRTA